MQMPELKEKLEFYVCEDYARDYHNDQIVEIAKIVDTNSSTDVLFVFYDKNAYTKYNYHMAAGLFDESGIPSIMIDDEHKDLLYDRPKVFYALMLHELGHYRNGDLEEMAERSTQSVLRERRQQLEAGKVFEPELNADAFAVNHVGKSTMIQAIDYMIKKRKERKNDPVKELSLKEFELRKKAISRMKI